MPDSSVAAIVLVGGASRRMGADKATLVVDGEAMADRVVRLLREQPGIDRIVLAGSPEVPDAPSGATAPERAGPMAGIVGAWRYLREQSAREAFPSPDPIVVLSCDLPAITAEVIEELVRRSQTGEHGAVAHDGERPQPLIAAYRPAAMEALEAAFENGERSVRKCFDAWDLRTIGFAAAVLADADCPADLDRFEVEWPAQG